MKPHLPSVPKEEAEALVDALWSLETVAAELDVTVKTARNFIAKGKLPAYRLAGERLIRVRKSDVMALLEPIPTAQKVSA